MLNRSSFKSMPTSASVKPGSSPRPADVAGAANNPALLGSGTFSAEQLSADSISFPAIYEAAIFYAADCYDAAQETLKEHLKTTDGKNSIRTWLMLFDLYQLTHNHQDFDSLSMLFTVKFERSPPIWTEGMDNSDPRRKEKRERKDFFLLNPGTEGALLEEIDKLEVFSKKMGSSRIEFSKISSILVEEAELFSIVFQRLRRQKIPIWFNNLDEFTALLKKHINEANGLPLNASQGYWSLLFELYILDSKLDEYEELGLEYAVAFEMSPPAWEAVVRPTGAGESGLPATSSSAANTPKESAGFLLKGVVGASSKEMLQQLSIYANTKQEVVVDMSGLLRIDFNAVNEFFEVIRAIHLSQKRVILSNLNELVAALLEVFGMTKHAILMRKKTA